MSSPVTAIPIACPSRKRRLSDATITTIRTALCSKRLRFFHLFLSFISSTFNCHPGTTVRVRTSIMMIKGKLNLPDPYQGIFSKLPGVPRKVFICVILPLSFSMNDMYFLSSRFLNNRGSTITHLPESSLSMGGVTRLSVLSSLATSLTSNISPTIFSKDSLEYLFMR